MLLQFVCARRCVALVDLGMNACQLLVTSGNLGSELLCMSRLHQIHGTTTETSTCQPRTHATFLLVGEVNHDIGFTTACFKIITVAGVGLCHQTSQRRQVACFQSVRCCHGSCIFRDDMAASLEHF